MRRLDQLLGYNLVDAWNQHIERNRQPIAPVFSLALRYASGKDRLRRIVASSTRRSKQRALEARGVRCGKELLRVRRSSGLANLGRTLQFDIEVPVGAFRVTLSSTRNLDLGGIEGLNQ
jgi:hypothetical protein